MAPLNSAQPPCHSPALRRVRRFESHRDGPPFAVESHLAERARVFPESQTCTALRHVTCTVLRAYTMTMSVQLLTL